MDAWCAMRRLTLSEYSQVADIVAAVAVVSILWLVMRMEQLEGERAAEVSGAAGFDPDDAMLAVPVAMALGWAEPLLLAACIGAPIAAVLMFWFFRRALNKA